MRTRTQTSQPDARAEALVATYERAGYRRVAPPILQPAEPFLDLSGEDIRRRMYLTADRRRPRAVPAARISPSRCRATISPRPRPGSAAGLLLSRPGVPRPRRCCRPRFLQAGIESFGRHGQGRRRRRDAGARPRGHRALRRRRRRKSAWATSACSPRWSPRSISRRPGSAAW